VATIDTLPVWDQIEGLFLGYTGRDATDAELFGHWYAMYDHIISAGQTPDEALYQIASDLSQRPAARALYPLLSTSVADPASPTVDHKVAAVIDHVWVDIFGHRPSSVASAYWENRILSGAVPLSELPARIENHAQGANATTLLDHIHAAVFAATYTSSEVGLTASEAPAVGVLIQFADGIDEFTGGGLLATVTPVGNFVTGSTAAATVANFSVGEYDLTGGTLAVGSVAAGVDAVIGAQTAGSHVAAGVTLVEITDQSFANASALATALEGSEHLIFSGAPAAGGASHVLVAYNDGTGSTRIADVGVMGSSPDTHFDTITGSDLVQLIGVSATSLNAHNIHFLA
jgi:hypothetical protein